MRSFANPVKPQWSTIESIRSLMGTNKAAWGVKLLLMTVSSYQVVCGSFCALLKTQHCCLPPCEWCCLPSASHPPPTPTLPSSRPPTPYIILQELKKLLQKPAVLAVWHQWTHMEVSILDMCFPCHSVASHHSQPTTPSQPLLSNHLWYW